MISKNILNSFEKKINYSFKNKLLLSQSLTHPSYFKDKKSSKISQSQFERFEFLGDRVLGLTVASLLFLKYREFNEGDLSKKHSYLVQKNFLFKISEELLIEKILQYSFKKDNKKIITSIFSDAVESLIGAIFIDGGYKPAYNFIKKFWSDYLDVDVKKIQDPKTSLQELSQQKSKKLPEYKIIKKQGPPHSPVFTVSLKVLELKKINGSGSSIREAERKAAAIALKLINEKKIIKS